MSDKQLKCPNCGQIHDDNYDHCPNCGYDYDIEIF